MKHNVVSHFVLLAFYDNLSLCILSIINTWTPVKKSFLGGLLLITSSYD